MNRTFLLVLFVSILVTSMYTSKVGAFECRYYKEYSIDQEGNCTPQDNNPIPSNSNCVVIIVTEKGEKHYCYVKGYHDCPAASDASQFGEKTTIYHPKVSCGYIENPISSANTEFEYCADVKSTTQLHGAGDK